MTHDRITEGHLARLAILYVRQSSSPQVQYHLESQRRQRGFRGLAAQLGWTPERTRIVDEDQGRSGSRSSERSGFEELVTLTALGRVGIILALEVARLARSNREWYQWLDVCAITTTLIADEEGLYDPRTYNDRLVLGLKGTMSEAELHLMRQRLVEAMRGKASRGELRRPLPAGYVWDEAGRIVKHPDEQVVSVVSEVFRRFARLGTVHQTHLSLCEERIKIPVRCGRGEGLAWTTPRSGQILQMLKNPAYAGAYAYGRRQVEESLDAALRPRKRVKEASRQKWHALLRDHHDGYIRWDEYERNQEQIKTNARCAAGAPREGESLLQGIMQCGRCGRSMHVAYGRTPGVIRYSCVRARSQIGEPTCQAFGAVRLERAVEALLLEALAPAGMEAMIRAAEQAGKEREALHTRREQEVARARYEVRLAQRQYEAVDPENRLVARELERRYEKALQRLETIKAETNLQSEASPVLSGEEERRLMECARDVGGFWHAPGVRAQDRKRIARCLLEAVTVFAPPGSDTLKAEVHWRGGERSQIEVPRGKTGLHRYATPPEVVELVRELALEFSDRQIARILSRKRLATPKGHSFQGYHVANLRHKHGIAPGPTIPTKEKDVYTAEEASERLGVSRRTVIGWVECGLLRGRQATLGAPWRIVVSEEDLARLRPTAGDPEWLTLKRAASLLHVSQKTLLEKVRSGALQGKRVRGGRRASWRIHLPAGTYPSEPTLF